MRPKYFIPPQDTLQDLELAAAQFLESRGYQINMPSEWETKKAFCERVGISEKTFTRKMKRRHVPIVKIEQGPQKRIVRLRSNGEFESYMRKRQ